MGLTASSAGHSGRTSRLAPGVPWNGGMERGLSWGVSAISITDEVWPQAKMTNVRHDYTAGYFNRSLDRSLGLSSLHCMNSTMT